MSASSHLSDHRLACKLGRDRTWVSADVGKLLTLGKQPHLTRGLVSSPASASSCSGTECGGHLISPGLGSPSAKWCLCEMTLHGSFQLEAWPSGCLTYDEKALLSRSLLFSRSFYFFGIPGLHRGETNGQKEARWGQSQMLGHPDKDDRNQLSGSVSLQATPLAARCRNCC